MKRRKFIKYAMGAICGTAAASRECDALDVLSVNDNRTLRFVEEQIFFQLHDLDSPSKIIVGPELFEFLYAELSPLHLHFDYQKYCQVLTMSGIEIERFDTEKGFWINEPWFLCIEQKKDCGPFGHKNVPVIIVKDVRRPTEADIIAA